LTRRAAAWYRPGVTGDALAAGSAPRRAAAGRADRLGLALGLGLAAGLAWAWTATATGAECAGASPLLPFLASWTLMMAAMMFPSLIPAVLSFSALVRPRSRRPLLAAGCFVAGYLAVWGLLGLPAHALLAGAHALGASWPELAARAAPLGGLMLVACGLYQLTPVKQRCLRHCRAPHLFLGQHWRDGAGGSLALGAHHGLYCAGCCASLMGVLLVVGVMDLAWMIGLSLLILLEKLVPAGPWIGRAAGLALCAAGVARVLA
jgi:predicted metal-binding membrane protein